MVFDTWVIHKIRATWVVNIGICDTWGSDYSFLLIFNQLELYNPKACFKILLNYALLV